MHPLKTKTEIIEFCAAIHTSSFKKMCRSHFKKTKLKK